MVVLLSVPWEDRSRWAFSEVAGNCQYDCNHTIFVSSIHLVRELQHKLTVGTLLQLLLRRRRARRLSAAMLGQLLQNALKGSHLPGGLPSEKPLSGE